MESIVGEEGQSGRNVGAIIHNVLVPIDHVSYSALPACQRNNGIPPDIVGRDSRKENQLHAAQSGADFLFTDQFVARNQYYTLALVSIF